MMARFVSTTAEQLAARKAVDKQRGKCHMAYMPGSHSNCTPTYHEQSEQERRDAELHNERVKLSNVVGHQRLNVDHIQRGEQGRDAEWVEKARTLQNGILDQELADRQAQGEAAAAEAARPRTDAEERVATAVDYWNRRGRNVPEQVMTLRRRWVDLVTAGASPLITQHIEAELSLLGWAVPAWDPVGTAEKAVEDAQRHVWAMAGHNLVSPQQELDAAEAALAAARRKK